jgi:hypothetical protein
MKTLTEKIDGNVLSIFNSSIINLLINKSKYSAFIINSYRYCNTPIMKKNFPRIQTGGGNEGQQIEELFFSENKLVGDEYHCVLA